MTLICLAGRAGSGKTTIAEHLRRTRGAVRYSLAEPLKRMGRAIWGWSDEQLWGPQAVRDIVSTRWGMSPRRSLQLLGTDAMRNVLGDHVWVRYLLERLDAEQPELAVVDDVRFIDEARRMYNAGARVVRLTNLNHPALGKDAHASEAEVERIPRALLAGEVRASTAEQVLEQFDALSAGWWS